MLRTVVSTSGSLRTRAAIDSAIVCVVCRLAPSGARTLTWNCDSSSCGRKFLLTRIMSGTVMKNVITMTTTMTQRWAIDQSSMRI